MKRDILIVVDMQNDFISGSLGTKEAKEIVPNVVSLVEKHVQDEKNIYFTRDTHYDDYLETFEGEHLPVEHCIRGTWGWEICDELNKYAMPSNTINKEQFGYNYWDVHNDFKEGRIERITICGLCTNICVLSNAIILRSLFPDVPIYIKKDCCAGTTPKEHEMALEVMKSNQIEVI